MRPVFRHPFVARRHSAQQDGEEREQEEEEEEERERGR